MLERELIYIFLACSGQCFWIYQGYCILKLTIYMLMQKLYSYLPRFYGKIIIIYFLNDL